MPTIKDLIYTHDALRRADNFFRRPNRWTKYSFHDVKNGEDQYCLVGYFEMAARRRVNADLVGDVLQQEMQIETERGPRNALIHFNDKEAASPGEFRRKLRVFIDHLDWRIEQKRLKTEQKRLKTEPKQQAAVELVRERELVDA